tara:strand:- start:885 stop:1775 length:891 start_codon:yes stop_codon:yes gene_type:complete
MIEEPLLQISIVMAVQNEAEHIGFIDELLKRENSVVGEILIIEDRSTDKTLEKCLALEKKYKNVKIFKNKSTLNLNQMIMFLLEKVETKYVHIRSPHDFYCDGFYRFHFNRLTREPQIQLSTNKSKNSNSSVEFKMEGLNLSRFWTKVYNQTLDHSISSCGFVAEIQSIKSVWNKYINFDIYTDWLVKKELSHFYRSVHSFKLLSFYNNEIEKEGVLAKENQSSANITKLLNMTHKSFWELENRHYVTFPEHEVGIIEAFCCLKPKWFKLNWLIAFTMKACLYTVKRMARFFISNR